MFQYLELLRSNIHTSTFLVYHTYILFVDRELQVIVIEPCVNSLYRQLHTVYCISLDRRGYKLCLDCCAGGIKAWGDNSSLFCFVVCLIPGWHFSRFTVWRDLASCEPSWHPYYLALCDPTYFVLLFLCQHAVPPAWLCLLSLLEGWGCFLLWHQDRHAALAHLPK